MRSFLYRHVPAFDSLRHYTWPDAQADVVAGWSVAAVAVPQAMAYAMIVGLPPAYGLYTAIFMTAIGALLDSSRQLINGPTNAISIALIGVVGAVASPDEKVQLAATMAFLIGLFQLAITLLRLGDLTQYISHSVIVGFTAGASVLLVLDQLKNLLGLQAMGSAHDHFLVRFFTTAIRGGPVHGPTLAIGLGTIGLVLALRWLKRRAGLPLFPEMLVAVCLAAGFTVWMDLEVKGVKVIGDIPAALPSFARPHLDYAQLSDLASSAFAVALLGLLEAISMAKAIAAVTRQKLDMNQQCLSEALANLGGSFFQCMPGSGSLTRSAINQQAGARTQWSGVVSAVAVAVTMLALAPWARFIPRSALAGILILTAGRMVNLQELHRHVRTSRFDAVIVASTAISACAISIEFCVLIGVFMSFLLAVPRTGQMLLVEYVVTPEGLVLERLEGDDVHARVLIFGLEGEMFFGSTVSLVRHLETIAGRLGQEARVVVLRMKSARNPDAVGLALLEEFLDSMQERGVSVILCGVRDELYSVLERNGLTARLEARHVFREQPVRLTSTMLAVAHAYALLGEPCAVGPRLEALRAPAAG